MHINLLAAKINRELGEGPVFEVLRKFEPEHEAIVYRLYQVKKVPDDWALIVGDAIHNLRGALDHLAWQLAIKHFDGVEPTDINLIKKIQFPVVMNRASWTPDNCINRKYMLKVDAAKLEKYQPFVLEPPLTHILNVFFGRNGLSNIDKHRTLPVVFSTVVGAGFKAPRSSDYRDCIPTENPKVIFPNVTRPLESNDEIARVPVTVLGPNPDVNLQPRIAPGVALSEGAPLIDNLNKAKKIVAAILSEFS